ncbi:MAG TPA: hypothetical protein VIH47_06230 [Solirubrobacterales bacterium]
MSRLAFEALAGEKRDGELRVPGTTGNAIRLYLSDKGAGRPAWPYPGFLRQSQTREDVSLDLEIDPDVWLQFEAEAEKQSVSAQQLLEHAAFYFAAELNAGRITQRILDDLDADEASGDAV